MSESIDQLAQDYYQRMMRAQPSSAHLLGIYDNVGDYEQVDRASEDAEIAELRDFATKADALDVAQLDEQQLITRSVISSSATTEADYLAARLRELPADPIFGEQESLAVIVPMFALPTAAVADAMPAKFDAIGRSFHQLARRVHEGVEHGRTSPRFAVADTIEQIDAALAVPVADDPLLKTAALPEGVDANALTERLSAAITDSIRPGLSAYRDALRDAMLPVSRSDEQCGLSWLPDGEAAYDACLRFFTTTTKSAQEIHDIGMAQIESLAEEYRTLGKEVVGTDDLDSIFEALRTDPKLHFTSAQQLVDQSEVAMARAYAAIPEWFEVLPQAPCGVEGVESGAKAYYFPPAGDGSRGGTFFINVGKPEDWGTFELESLAFHEGIPGHHLQLAIAAELPDSIPEFRKHLHNSAYAEGWGLYSERLSDEMGLYSSPVDRMGMLSADSLRAGRLVVDTGLHALGWSRQRAIDFMVKNSPMTEGIVRPEIDRYIVSPGQAASYMIGRLEIQRMRREAEQRQGQRFDIKSFHSAVLDSGSLPLDVLDKQVKARLAG